MTEKIRPIPSATSSLSPSTSLEQQQKDYTDSKKEQQKRKDTSRKGLENSLFDEFV
ncbi:MAG: hypothetical protein ACI9QV_000800 [Methylophagaceae bacterium]|jgi:hypothetical protein